MESELHRFIEQARLHRAAIEGVANLLPAEDPELDRIIGEAVRNHDQKSFMYLTLAALSRDRPVDARHLAGGAMLIPGASWMAGIALRLSGDVAEHLLAGLRHSTLSRENEAMALLVIAVWCQEHRNGVFPEEMILAARKLARVKNLDSTPQALLGGLAARTQNTDLTLVLRQRYPNATQEQWDEIEQSGKKLADGYIELRRTPVPELVQEKPSNDLSHGRTIRRSVARIGRNSPCHCGSGRKYKHCCCERDRERLHHASDVAGHTEEEVHADLERHLTPARMEKTHPHELARLDPKKIPRPLLESYFIRLACFKLFDCAINAFQMLGYADDLEEAWDFVMFWTTHQGRKDIAEQLMKLRAPTGFTEDKLGIGPRLLLADGDDVKCLKLLNDGALSALQTDDIENWLGFAYGVTVSKFSPLGILIYRSFFPLVPPDRAAQSFECVLEARDRLKLSPDDPFSDLIDQRLGERDNGKDAVALREAQHKLEAKGEEVRELKESLAQIQREISLREKERDEKTLIAADQPAADENALKELREKVGALKTALKDRHNERNDLRRQLRKAQTDLETLRQNAAQSPVSPPADVDTEEDLLLPQDLDGSQPLRIIEFPRNFQSRLEEFPRHVARGALIMLGRLAAGEEAAFIGAVRLKACPTIMRQRIGIDFRLLFRTLPDRIQVVDLIPRQDLERKIKTLV